MQKDTFIEKISKTPYVQSVLSFFGLGLYIIQSFIYAHTQNTVLDEGAYLVKGFLFTSGQTFPFEDFGVQTNHMPLSFLIPGIFQKWFGPGLRTGRYYAVLLGFIMVIGLWLLIRRIAGNWWAVGAIFAIALNTAMIKIYSVAASQVLVASLIIWILYFALGPNRKPWHRYIGAALAGILALTRINMSPVLFFLIIYLIWEAGWREGFIAALSGGSVWLIGHIVFWPGILKIWSYWIPETLTPNLDIYRKPANAHNTWTSPSNFRGRMLSLAMTVRFNFLAILGFLMGLVGLKNNRKSATPRFKMMIFLLILFGFLFGIHIYATLGGDYCVFCLPIYTTFFSQLGYILLIIVLSSWIGSLTLQTKKHTSPRWVKTSLFTLISLVGFSLHNEIATFLSLRKPVKKFLEWEIPRISLSSNGIQEGTVPFWAYINHYTGLSKEVLTLQIELGLKIITPILLGILAGYLIWILANTLKTHKQWGLFSLTQRALLITVVAGLILSPTTILSGGFTDYDCNGDVITSYEKVGEYLNDTLPSGAKIYWRGGRSAVPLLYIIPEIDFYWSQLNGDYSFQSGGNIEELERFGLWSEELAQIWIYEADYILVEESLHRDFEAKILESGDFTIIGTSPQAVECRLDSQIIIYQQIENNE